MADIGIIGLVLILINFVFSYKGFSNEAFLKGYAFNIDRILINKDYKRLITSGFLHVSWMHLIFNMVGLYMFGGMIENSLGGFNFLIIYFASLLGDGLFSLYVHRNHGDYSSVGASGAVCGIVFASIALFPGMSMGFFFIPISIPAWIYGAFFVLYSIYGIKYKVGNSAHEAHLGGALIGMAAALIMEPSAFLENYFAILVIAVPAIIFIYLVITKPHVLLIDNISHKKQNKFYSVDHKYNAEKNDSQREIDLILEKISRNGMSSLTRKEKERLKQYSQTVR
jgi:membrane associated rhomboid family serine protease